MSSSECSGEVLDLTYRKIKELYDGVDSYDVVNEVNKYRNYWKPDKINVVLLAESHVFTSDEDFKIEMNYSGLSALNPSYPRSFVRFVYCIGYSESTLFANRPSNPNFRNPGTWQYWKIFCACASESEKIDYSAILKKTTKSLFDRVNNKIGLLNKLKDKGIWLVDSSIVGLYKKGEKPPRNITERIVLTSWNNYVKYIIRESKPKIMICIGKTVWDVLESKIKEMNIQCDWINQPQAHLTREEREKQYKKLNKLCSEHCGLGLAFV
jgi:hypothetical protein